MNNSIKRETLKKIKSAIIIVIALFGTIQYSSADVNKTNEDCVEIIYFHSKNRCVTCYAIENATKEEIKKDFAKELNNGKIKFKVVDISKDENKKIAEKYEVSWTGLYINKWKAGKETSKNITNFAFSNARTSPEIFKKGIKKTIQELLK